MRGTYPRRSKITQSERHSLLILFYLVLVRKWQRSGPEMPRIIRSPTIADEVMFVKEI